MPIPQSHPMETIVRRKENVMQRTSPQEKGRKSKGVVYFAWFSNETTVQASEQNKPWLAQPLANRWALRRQYVEPGEEAKEISFHFAHIVDGLLSLLGPSFFRPGQKVQGSVGSQQLNSTTCHSGWSAPSAPSMGLPSAGFSKVVIKIIFSTTDSPYVWLSSLLFWSPGQRHFYSTAASITLGCMAFKI